MYKIIGGDQRQYGPVNADEVRRWIAEGRLNGRSLVQPEGATDWQPLSAFAEFAGALGAQTSPPPPSLSVSPPEDREAWEAEILARPVEVRIGDCLTRAWRLMTQNFGLIFGASAVVWAIGFCQFIPLVGLAYKVLWGALYGGLFLVVIKAMRRERTTINEVFSGFNIALGQLILAGVVSRVLAGISVCLCVLPYFYLTVAWVFSLPLVIDKRLEFWPAMELSRKVVTKVWFEMFALLVIVFLPMIFMAAYGGLKTAGTIFPLVQQILNAGPQTNMDWVFKAIMKANLASISLSFLTRVVLLFNLPFAMAALVYAYENLFGPRPAREA